MANEYAVAADIDKEIVDIINAAAGVWGGTLDGDPRYTPEAVTAARRAAAKEVINAVASNHKSGHFGDLATWVAVVHDAFLPDHDGEPGIPRIIPFDGAAARAGFPADPDQIDAWRDDVAGSPIYSGALDGTQVGHDQVDGLGRMSPVACRYDVTAGVLKFTGLSAEVPLIQITETMLDDKIATGLAPAVAKRAIPRLVKEGTNLAPIARDLGADGKQDLVEIAGGALRVKPVSQPKIIQAQEQTI